MKNVDGNALTALPITPQDLAALFADLPNLWERATVEERRGLVRPLIERVYVDLDTRLIGALVASEGFEALIQGALVEAQETAVRLIPNEELHSRRTKRELVEIGEPNLPLAIRLQIFPRPPACRLPSGELGHLPGRRSRETPHTPRCG